MSENNDFNTLCKRCYLKKYKISKKNINQIILSNWREECECCGKIDKIVVDIKDADK